jgi:hypothetical protein
MNLVQKSVQAGGKLAPLVFPHDLIALMNPSIYIDSDGDILVNVRATNYTLYHSENKQLFPSPWGPLAYLHPEKDQRLITENYIVRLDKNLEVINHKKVEMLNLHTPIWEFVGLEDARLVQWDNKYYIIGVRRDTTTSGQGRMELTQIDIDKETWTVKEVNRDRIPTPEPDISYCEKNWMPIADRPYNFIKWASPVEVVQYIPEIKTTKQVSLKQGIRPKKDQRGGSQLVRWGDGYISITHEVDLFKNYLMQKDGIYRHRLCVWDNNIDLVGLSKPFSFLDARIEFCVGAAKLDGDLLLSFSVSDNCAFILRTPGILVDELIVEALNYEN